MQRPSGSASATTLARPLHLSARLDYLFAICYLLFDSEPKPSYRVRSSDGALDRTIRMVSQQAVVLAYLAEIFSTVTE
jgi:hypothetical protein